MSSWLTTILFPLQCHRQMEWITTKHHSVWYNQHFQEWIQLVEEESDGLLHGPAGPPGQMASSALKDSKEQVRPHLSSYLVSIFRARVSPCLQVCVHVHRMQSTALCVCQLSTGQYSPHQKANTMNTHTVCRLIDYRCEMSVRRTHNVTTSMEPSVGGRCVHLCCRCRCWPRGYISCVRSGDCISFG